MTQKRKTVSQSRGTFKNLDIYDDNLVNPSTISIKKIVLPESQPRRFFSPEAMADLTISVQKNGILQPLLVRSKGDNYELVAGERRYRAAKEVGLEEVPVLIKEMTDNEAKQFALLENIQRDDLNPIEETEAILNLLEIKLDVERKEVVSLIRKVSKILTNPAKDIDVPKEQIQIIKEFFEGIGRFSVESFRTHRLPLLNLPTHILDAINQGKIAYSKARMIARVEEYDQQVQLLKEAIDKDLSASQIKEKIKLLKPLAQQDDLYQRVNQTYKKMQKTKSLWSNQRKRKKLESLLGQLEKLLDD